MVARAAVLVMLGVSIAWAKPPAKCVRLYREGDTLYRDGRYADAAARFEAAWSLCRPANAVRYLALCHEKLGKLDVAVDHYERYVALPEVAPADAAKVREKIAALRALPSRARVGSEPAGAQVFVDDRAAGPRGRTPVEFDLAAGSHLVIAELEGHEPAEDRVEAGLGRPIELTLRLRAIPAPPALPPPVVEAKPPAPAATPSPRPHAPPRRGWLRPTGWTAIGLGVAALAVGGVFAVKASGRGNDYDALYDESCGPMGCAPEAVDDLEAKFDEGQKFERVAWAAFAAGGVLATGGVALLLWPQGDGR